MNDHGESIEPPARELAQGFRDSNDADGAMRWRLSQVRELMLDVSSVLEGYDPERRRTPSEWGQVADVAYVVERLGEAVRHLGVFTTEAEMREALGLDA